MQHQASNPFGSFFKEFKSDFSASIIVFFVALPLCLGIPLASGAHLFSGIIAGVVGGIVVGAASGSALGVSGPAAGLTVIVLTATQAMGWAAFLTAVVIAGGLQILMGVMRAGFIAYFFPSSVIKGMLCGIGLLIILKQIPHALGYDKTLLVDLAYFYRDGQTTLDALYYASQGITWGALFISAISIGILVLWDMVLIKKSRFFQLLQGPIVVVIVGILLHKFWLSSSDTLQLADEHLVHLPVVKSFTDFIQQFTHPDFSVVRDFVVWKTAIVLAIVASLETLLCVEATDKLDPLKRTTPTNRELVAQGLGNMVSGFLGGLPVTQVIIRSSANITFGAKTKLSAILHGVFLLVSATTLAGILNQIPLASLAAILIAVGYKLAKPQLFMKIFQLGWEQFVPFMTTIIGILTTDLLTGISIGMVFGIVFTLHHSYRNAYYMKDIVTNENNQTVHHLVLAEEVSFFNKASILEALNKIPENSTVIIDCANSKAIAYDVVELIRDYKTNAKTKNITVQTLQFIEPISQ